MSGGRQSEQRCDRPPSLCQRACRPLDGAGKNIAWAADAKSFAMGAGLHPWRGPFSRREGLSPAGRPIGTLVEEPPQKARPTVMAICPMASLIVPTVAAVSVAASPMPAVTFAKYAKCSRRCGIRFGRAALDDLVEFAAVQPYTPAVGAVVNLDPLPLAHAKLDVAGGTKQPLVDISVSHRNLQRIKDVGSASRPMRLAKASDR